MTEYILLKFFGRVELCFFCILNVQINLRTFWEIDTFSTIKCCKWKTLFVTRKSTSCSFSSTFFTSNFVLAIEGWHFQNKVFHRITWNIGKNCSNLIVPIKTKERLLSNNNLHFISLYKDRLLKMTVSFDVKKTFLFTKASTVLSINSLLTYGLGEKLFEWRLYLLKSGHVVWEK